MSRPLRIEYKDAWHHVMNRGRRAEPIFLYNSDYQSFLNVLQESVSLWNINIAAYCLMPNHYHLLVQTPEANLSRCMRHINGIYTQRFNRRHKVDGTLFRGRYKSILIGEENYLVNLVRYICFNPVKAGIVANPEDYPWSCYNDYLSSKNEPNWLNKELILSRLKSKTKSKKTNNLLLSEDAPEDIYRFFAQKNLPSILGSKEFVDQTRHHFSRQIVQTEVPVVKDLEIQPESVIKQVCKYFKVKEEALYHQRRGTANIPRHVAIYLVRTKTRITLAEVGEIFQITNYSTVSSSIQRLKKRMNSDPDLLSKVDKINQLLQ
jgi:putative transposase